LSGSLENRNCTGGAKAWPALRNVDTLTKESS
jgi:hypothetical protein